MLGNRKERLVGSLLDCMRHEGVTEMIHLGKELHEELH